ncbi:MAG TPA: sigma factor, partial [Gammaproteobacteria bacterium]|nr:sigma factor [Gammaproteobacteria bacterium]
MGGRDPRSDDELVAACNVGDADEATRAFEALYRRHRDFVLRVARRFTRDRELALDALQETFAYLLRKFPPAGSGLVLTARLQTLLYPVAKN